MNSRVMLTAGEQAVLREFFPSHRWERGLVKISEAGLEKIRKQHAELERQCRTRAGTKKFRADKAYQCEMLERVIAKASEPSATLG